MPLAIQPREGRGAIAVVYGDAAGLRNVDKPDVHMTLLKIGKRYINFDLVHYVEEDPSNGVRIFFSATDGGAEMLQLEGEEALALRRWLHQNSMEIKPPLKSWHRS